MSRDERSKSQRKRDALAAKKLGEELIALKADKLALFELPDTLIDAIEAARGMHQFGALRRQKQPIVEKLERLREPGRRATVQLHAVESWRDRLLAEGDPVLAELKGQFPDANLDAIAELVFDARRNPGDKKPKRALFRQINELMQTANHNAKPVE
ncbi:MAG: ribosome biogenesis factor YjgA [Chromatiales bacterium]